MSEKHDFTLRFDGQCHGFTIVVNTDEDIREVIERLRIAAAGPLLRAVIIGAYKVEREQAEGLFRAAQEESKKRG